jgi:hypothetical protein
MGLDVLCSVHQWLEFSCNFSSELCSALSSVLVHVLASTVVWGSRKLHTPGSPCSEVSRTVPEACFHCGC